MIKPTPSRNNNNYYKNKQVNQLVDIILDNIDNYDFFIAILSLISFSDYSYAKNYINVLKLEYLDEIKVSTSILNEIEFLIKELYSGKHNTDNLRGVFLELLIFKFLNRKYANINSYISSLDCHVNISGNITKKTVDVFALCDDKGFICECKVSHKNFKSHIIANLNQIFIDSSEILKPYIFTLSTQIAIKKKLNDIIRNNKDNDLVNLDYIKVFGVKDIYNFFS